MQHVVSVYPRAASIYLPRDARSETEAGASVPGSVNEGRVNAGVGLFRESAWIVPLRVPAITKEWPGWALVIAVIAEGVAAA